VEVLREALSSECVDLYSEEAVETLKRLAEMD